MKYSKPIIDSMHFFFFFHDKKTTFPPDRCFSRAQVDEKLSRAIGLTLEELDTKDLFLSTSDKGIAGKIVEQCVLGCKGDNKQKADICVDGVSTEIKTTGLRLNKSLDTNEPRYRAKEPVSITAVSIDDIANQTFESSHLWDKLAHLLFVYYQYLSKTTADFEDYKAFPLIGYDFYEMDEYDRELIENDFNIVRNYIAEIQNTYSGEDRKQYYPLLSTNINKQLTVMDTAPKYPNPPRFRLKATFVTAIANKTINKGYQWQRLKKSITKYEDLDRRCKELTKRYHGYSISKLIDEFNLNVTPASKNIGEFIVLSMFEAKATKINQIEDFVKIGVIAKTLTLTPEGKEKEDNKLCPVDFSEWCENNTEFEDSAIYEYFREHYFLYIIFKQAADKKPENNTFIGFKRVVFTDDFINTEVRRTWEEVRHLVFSHELRIVREYDKKTGQPRINPKSGTYTEAPNFPKQGRRNTSSYHPVFFRGSGTDSSDKYKTEEVNGLKMLPQEVWLDGYYVVENILQLKPE